MSDNIGSSFDIIWEEFEENDFIQVEEISAEEFSDKYGIDIALFEEEMVEDETAEMVEDETAEMVEDETAEMVEDETAEMVEDETAANQRGGTRVSLSLRL